MKIRYIRDWQNGRTVNGVQGTNCAWRQIMAIDYFGKNIAKDKADNGDFPGDFLVGGGAMWYFLTDENFNTTLWTKDKPNERKSVTIDLGDIYDIDKLVIARAKNPAICKETKTEVSVDNIVWHTIFDSSVEGTYEEQQNGRELKLPDNRFNIPNQDSSLGEIINFFDDYSEFNKVQKNVLKTNLIDKGVEVTDNDKMSTLIGKVSSMNTRKYGVGFFKPIYSIPETKYESSSYYITRAKYTVKSKDTHIDCVRMFSKVRRYYNNDGEGYDYHLRVLLNNEHLLSITSTSLKDSVVIAEDSRLLTLKNGDVITLQTSSNDNSGYIEFLLEFGYASENLAD